MNLSEYLSTTPDTYLNDVVSHYLLSAVCGFDGIEEDKNANSVSISAALPNPCLTNAIFTINNQEGQQIRPPNTISSQLGQSTYELKTTDLAAGVYTCHLSIGNTHISRKLIKQ